MATYRTRSAVWACEWAFVLYPLLSLTLTVPPIWEQLVATWARAVIRARDVHTLVDTQLPSLVQTVHFTLIYICQQRRDHMLCRRLLNKWITWPGRSVMYVKVPRTEKTAMVSVFSAFSFAFDHLWLLENLTFINYILRATKRWPQWLLISSWPLERIILFVTDWLHRLLPFVTILITKEAKDSGIPGSFEQ